MGELESLFCDLLVDDSEGDELLRRELERWLDRTARIVETRESALDAETLLEAWRWARALDTHDGATSDGETVSLQTGWLCDEGLCRLCGPRALDHLRHRLEGGRTPTGDGADLETAYLREAFRREYTLRGLDSLSDEACLEQLIGSTEAAVATLQTLRDPDSGIARRLVDLIPPLEAYVSGSEASRTTLASPEHEPPPEATRDGDSAHPLLDHLADRSLGLKLRGLELRDRARFQRDDALSVEAFEAEADIVDALAHRGLLPVVRATLLLMDVAKGGDRAMRRRWRRQFDLDLSVHNTAARELVESTDLLRRFPPLRDAEPLRELVLQLIAHHGLAGQAVRGETPLSMFAEFVEWLRSETDALADALETTRMDAIELAVDCLRVVNTCDTAAVREGLFDDELHRQIRDVEGRVRELALAADPPEGELRERLIERSPWRSRALQQWGALDTEEVPLERRAVIDRLLRLRQGRLAAGEPAGETARLVESLADGAFAEMARTLRRCQLWYCESGTGQLTPAGQLKLLALALRAADEEVGLDVSSTFYVNFAPLVPILGDDTDPATKYRVRFVDTLLAPHDLEAILLGEVTFEDIDSSLGWLEFPIGGAPALIPRLELSEEAEALFTLLPLYERKSSAAFHDTLKRICDLYELRKDEFDRISHERGYLETMNAARRDKARMLEWVEPGTVVEVGPGGGVVLDLLEEHVPDGRIVGVDTSREVVERLRERKAREARFWEIVHGDAFELPELLGRESVDTVVFCSVLHEIYSFHAYGDDGERFRLESVRDVLQAAWRTLRPGGRLVIRDGVEPPAGERILEFDDPEGPAYLELFVDQFEGRDVDVEWLDADRVRMPVADAMEFLYCYTWGAEHFPYEVREQYGVWTYDAYGERIVEWLSDVGPAAELVELPAESRSYLQDGYREHLESKVSLYDGDGEPVELPDSNCLIVVQKREDGAQSS